MITSREKMTPTALLPAKSKLTPRMPVHGTATVTIMSHRSPVEEALILDRTSSGMTLLTKLDVKTGDSLSIEMPDWTIYAQIVQCEAGEVGKTVELKQFAVFYGLNLRKQEEARAGKS